MATTEHTPQSFELPTEFNREARSPVADICRTIGYADISAAYTYQEQVASDISTLLRLTYPPGFQQRHAKDLHLLEENRTRYDKFTEDYIRKDPPSRILSRFAKRYRDAGKELPPGLMRTYMIRRTIVACMLEFSGHHVATQEEDFRVHRVQ